MDNLLEESGRDFINILLNDVDKDDYCLHCEISGDLFNDFIGICETITDECRYSEEEREYLSEVIEKIKSESLGWTWRSKGFISMNGPIITMNGEVVGARTDSGYPRILITISQ